MKKIYLIFFKIFFKNFVNSDMGKIGKIYKKIRCFLFKKYTGNKSKNLNIQKGASFAQDTIIGDNSGIGENCLVTSNVEIGRNVMMGPDVKIYTINHNFKRIDIPMNEQGFQKSKKVIIEDDVWIGANVIILPGVKIGTGSILGAGAVISKNVEPYSIMAGNPARKVKSRLNDEI